MLGAQEFLRNQLQAVIEECGGYMSDEANDKLDELVSFVTEHPESEIEPVSTETVTCKLCGEEVPGKTAHRHSGGWIGDECCWDERLRRTE